MECVKNCQLCPKFITSNSIVYNATVNQLIVDLPASTYFNCEKKCIALTQTIPTDTTINAQVVFTINGDATVGYPFLYKDCTPVLASQVRTRRLYPVRVTKGISTGVFKYIGDCPLPRTGTVPATGLPITTATTVQAQAVKVGGK